MMFSPFLGEVILGKILSTTPQWIRGELVDSYVTDNSIPRLLPGHLHPSVSAAGQLCLVSPPSPSSLALSQGSRGSLRSPANVQ